LKCLSVAGFRLFVPGLKSLEIEVFGSRESGSAIGDDRVRLFVN